MSLSCRQVPHPRALGRERQAVRARRAGRGGRARARRLALQEVEAGQGRQQRRSRRRLARQVRQGEGGVGREGAGGASPLSSSPSSSGSPRASDADSAPHAHRCPSRSTTRSRQSAVLVSRCSTMRRSARRTSSRPRSISASCPSFPRILAPSPTRGLPPPSSSCRFVRNLRNEHGWAEAEATWFGARRLYHQHAPRTVPDDDPAGA